MIHVPSFCDEHNAQVVREGGFTQLDPWRAALAVTQVAMFQVAAAHPSVQARCAQTPAGRDANDLSLVLAEIGCLGCFLPRAFAATVRELRTNGLSWLAAQTRDETQMSARVERMLAL